METGRAGTPSRDVVRCADILGSFGVTPADVRAQRREYHTTVPPGEAGGDASLEAIIADVLADERDRAATVRQLICHGDRGITCSARYAQRALGRELEAVFESIGWSLEWTRTGPAETGRDRLELTATDPKGRTREATVTYPQTPLADDNLPAVLHAVDERLLAGTGATVVPLSTGVDRWRAALIEEDELESLQERYGRRISAFDRPLLPEHDLEAYVPEDTEDASSDDPTDASEAGPWPAWALERASRRSTPLGRGSDPAPEASDTDTSVASLIEEAEPESEETAANEGTTTDSISPTEAPPSPSSASASAETDGFEIRGGSPTVSRVSGDADSSPDPSPRDVADAMLEDQRERTAERRDGPDGRERSDGVDDASSADDPSDDGFGTLSGTSKTARVGNDSFGTDDEFETEHDRYSALGVALGAGGAITVEGMLEDDEFLPELPAVEPKETRIEFAESFDPDAVTTAKAAGEQEGFEWVDSGTLETTRISNQ